LQYGYLFLILSIQLQLEKLTKHMAHITINKTQINPKYFHENTIGLPDHVFLDTNGKPCPEVFRKNLGFGRELSRNVSRREKVNKITLENFLARHAKRAVRVKLFWKHVGHFKKLGASTFLNNDQLSSWEPRVFEAILPGWHLMPTDGTPNYSALLEKEQQELSEWFNKYVPIDATLEKKKLSESGIDHATLMQCTSEVYLCLLLALANWESLDIDRRIVLANAAFGCFTVFGPEALQRMVDIVPSLMDYYHFVNRIFDVPSKLNVVDIGLKTMASIDDSTALTGFMENDNIASGRENAPDSLLDFYIQLATLAEKGKNTPFDKAIAEQLNVLYSYFPALSKKYQLSDDDIHRAFSLISNFCISLGSRLNIAEFKDEDFQCAFRKTWLCWLDSCMKESVLITFFNDVSSAISLGMAALSDEISNLSVQIDVLQTELNVLKKTGDEGSFKERRDNQKTIIAKSAQNSALLVRLDELNEAATEKMLPAGVKIDDLVFDQEPPTLSIALYHDDAVAAITAQLMTSSSNGSILVLQTFLTAEEISSAVTENVKDVPIASNIVTAATNMPVPMLVENPRGSAESSPLLVAATGQFDEQISLEGLAYAPVSLVVENVENVAQIQVSSESDKQNLNVVDESGVTRNYPSEYLMDPSEASVAYLNSVADTGMATQMMIENIAVLWCERGYYGFGHAMLNAAVNVAWSGDDLFDKSLIRAAYFGGQVWPGDQSSISTVQKQLNFISHQYIEQCLDRRAGGRLAPYLIFCACFQASIFSGNYTNAPRLLAQVAEYFDGATQRMIADVVGFTNQGNTLDLIAFRTNSTGVDEKKQNEILQLQLANWRDRIINKQTGWAPARKALHACLSLPDFSHAIATIEGSLVEGADHVQAFVDKYSDSVTVNSLIESQILKVQNGVGVQSIERNARVWLQNNIEEFSKIARVWLIENRNRMRRNTDVDAFSGRLLTQLRSVIAEFQAVATKETGLEHRCGARLALTCTESLLRFIEGDASVVISTKRVNATFTLADDLFALENLTNNFDGQMKWLAEQVSSPFDLKAATARAEQCRDFRLAELLILMRQDSKEDMTVELREIKKRSDSDLHALRQKADRVQTMVHNAALSNLIADDRAYQLTADNDYLLEKINSLDTLDSVRQLYDDVDVWERDLQTLFSEEIQKKQDVLANLVRKARVQFGAEAVSDAWLKQINRAFEANNLPAAEEMINHLESSITDGSKLSIEEITPNPFITGFLATEKQLFEAIEIHRNPREIGKYLLGNPIVGLDFVASQTNCTDVIIQMAEWRSHPKKSLDKTFYESIVLVLEYVGFQVIDRTLSSSNINSIGFEQGPRFKRASIAVSGSETGRPFPLFDDIRGGATQLNVIMAFGDWNAQDFRGYLETLGLAHNRTLLISAKPLTNSERNEFALICKINKITAFHIDPVMAAYMGSLPSNDRRLRNFLLLSVPWTYYNPYVQGDVRRPAPYEMRYGRQNDVQKLTQRDGTAIVFGGRQLGKTTILHEAVRVFHNPSQQQFAYYRQMDGDMARLEIVSKDRLASARVRVWAEIYACLKEAGILPDRALDIESKIKAIGDEFKKDGPSKVLICMDEIDPILKLDHAGGFSIFRGISELVNLPNGRFKVVIAGLENVKRFEDAPNFPLPQLGASLQVSILPTRDAMQLVNEPLRIFGYEFEDDLLAASILFTTNRHPGLIHIFCAELLAWMAKLHKGVVGSIKITANDVDHIARDKEVNRLIRNRFDMTLNLDKRYLVIVYGLINSNRSTGYFTASQAKTTSEYWLSEVFKPMTEKTFEAFLEELVGLGVLRVSADGREFALRSVNILKLVGNQAEIEEKLLQTIQDMTFDDPLSCHGITEQTTTALQNISPLTYRDEKFLIRAEATEERSNPERTKKYSVAVIVGSEALGLDVDKLKVTLPPLGDFEEAPLSSRSKAYEIKHSTDKTLKGPAGFRPMLEKFIEERNNNAAQPVIWIIELTGMSPLSQTLNLLDIAHEVSSTTGKMKSHLRVVFLLTPRALWQWENDSHLTSGRERLQTFIVLDKWSKTALSYLLSHLGMENNSIEVDSLHEYSNGWYSSLNALLAAARVRNKNSLYLKDLNYASFENEKPRKLLDFLNKTGAMEFEWSPIVLQFLSDNITFDADDVEVFVMELSGQHGIDPSMAPAMLRWFERLRLVEPTTASGTQRGTITYRVNPGIARALKVTKTTESLQ
jgi:hypothetical protein